MVAIKRKMVSATKGNELPTDMSESHEHLCKEASQNKDNFCLHEILEWPNLT